MYIQIRRRKLVFPYSSFLSDSFLFFSLHLPLNLNCPTNWKKKEPFHSEDQNSRSLTDPVGAYYEGEIRQRKGNDYEVFLSFRGKDTRKGFTDFLYTSLVDAGIQVFRDDNELHVGKEIGPEILNSIMQSKISIPIISEDYVSSKWCLCELTQMLKCKRSGGQIVMPIFYKVEPSQLRKPRGRLRNAINAHKKNLNEMAVKEWEEALKEVSSLKGLESEKIDSGHEGALIKIIVQRVLGELKRRFQLNVPEQLVGVDDHVEQIMGKINGEFHGKRIIGIYGMGGIGKTTLAKVLYNKLSSQFDHCSFLADIRETSHSKGIEYLQKQLISNIIRNLWDVSNADEGASFIKSRFTSKKVLVLLDDITDDDHLKNLVGDGSRFEVGSIVIITTRDKSILDRAEAGYMYPLCELSFDQSLVLFSKHAFRKDSPPSDYTVISRKIVSATGGLPLALEVIGSFLYGKTKGAWNDMSKRLKKVPHEKVQEKLKISYDALNYEEKQIFLDIACYFVGSSQQNPSQQYLTYMWDVCDFYPKMGIEVLSLMSLIKRDKYGKLVMHDQLRDLGRELVRLEDPKEPQERSRLWSSEEALEVLDDNKGTKKIEALSLGKYGTGRRFTAEQFRGMTNLRFLQIDGANVTGDFQGLLPKVRWLQWKNCPSDFGAANFHPKRLVILDLSESAISEDWEGWTSLEMATKLKVLNLRNCRNLIRTPDLSALKSLESLDLSHGYNRGNNCFGVKDIHPSIEKLTSLADLRLSRTRITKLPEGIGNLQNLRMLTIEGTRIRELPDAVGMLAKLQWLSATHCKNLERLPSNIGGLVSLKNLFLAFSGISCLPESISKLSSLRDLILWGCGMLQEVPELPSGLTFLNISCQGTSLPCLSHLSRLEQLHISECPRLEFLPELPTGLLKLSIEDCGKLKGSMNLLEWKQQLHAGHCPKGLLDLPNSKVLREMDAASGMSSVDIQGLGGLEHLQVSEICNCMSTGQLLDLSSLKILRELYVLRCEIITEIRVLDGSVSLGRVDIYHCSSLRSIDVLNLKNLWHFVCTNCENLVEIRGLEGLVHKPDIHVDKCPSLRQALDALS